MMSETKGGMMDIIEEAKKYHIFLEGRQFMGIPAGQTEESELWWRLITELEKLRSSNYATEVSLGNQIDSLRDELAGMRATIEANDATIESLRNQLSEK